jgi:hypothetical protein
MHSPFRPVLLTLLSLVLLSGAGFALYENATTTASRIWAWVAFAVLGVLGVCFCVNGYRGCRNLLSAKRALLKAS